MRSRKIEKIISDYCLEECDPNLAAELRHLAFPAPMPGANSILTAFPVPSTDMIVKSAGSISTALVKDPQKGIEMISELLNGHAPESDYMLSQNEIISIVTTLVYSSITTALSFKKKTEELDEIKEILGVIKMTKKEISHEEIITAMLKGKIPINEEDVKTAPDDAVVMAIELAKEINMHYEAAESPQYSIETEQRNLFNDRYSMFMKEARDRGLVQ